MVFGEGIRHAQVWPKYAVAKMPETIYHETELSFQSWAETEAA